MPDLKSFCSTKYPHIGSYNPVMSLIPFYVPLEVEYCTEFNDWYANGQGVKDCFVPDKAELKKRSEVCANILGEHKKKEVFRVWGTIIAAALVAFGISRFFRKNDDGNNGKRDRLAGFDRMLKTPVLSVPAAKGKTKVGGKGNTPKAEKTNDQVWSDSVSVKGGGWTGIGSIPHSMRQPGTKFVVGAVEVALARAQDKKDFSVVEVGANLATLSEIIATRLGVRVIATDVKPSPPGIEGVSPLLTFERASAASLPFATSSQDAYVSSFVWEYVGEVALKEVARVLKPGGTFVSVMHHRGSPMSRGIVGAGRLSDIALNLADGNRKNAHDLYTSTMQALDRGEYVDGGWLERFVNRTAFKNYLTQAYHGTLSEKFRNAVMIQQVAGHELEWIMGFDQDGIKKLFEANGFEIVEIKPTTFGPLGLITTFRGLGIVARKKVKDESITGIVSGGQVHVAERKSGHASHRRNSGDVDGQASTAAMPNQVNPLVLSNTPAIKVR